MKNGWVILKDYKVFAGKYQVKQTFKLPLYVKITNPIAKQYISLLLLINKRMKQKTNNKKVKWNTE